MFGVIGRILGTDKAVNSVISNASNALDKLVYTNEEKAEDQAKAVAESRAMVIDWMKATSGQNLARRLIALVITAIWCLQYVTMMALSATAVWMESPDKFIECSKVIGGYAENMNGAMMLILAFYFAAPHMGSVVQGAMTKFGK